jgi:hypothetical protein
LSFILDSDPELAGARVFDAAGDDPGGDVFVAVHNGIRQQFPEYNGDPRIVFDATVSSETLSLTDHWMNEDQVGWKYE